jgi:hypothetical protein
MPVVTAAVVANGGPTVTTAAATTAAGTAGTAGAAGEGGIEKRRVEQFFEGPFSDLILHPQKRKWIMASVYFTIIFYSFH